MRPLVFILAAVFAAAPALGADKPKPGKDGEPGTNVEMPFLMIPMAKDGKLLGYSYVTSKLVASSQKAADEIRNKIAFIQDVYVRDVNAAPMNLASDPTQVDRAALTNRLVADARRVVGPTKVVRIVFGDPDGGDKDMGIKFSPLHPLQTPIPAEKMDDVPPQAAAAP